MQNKGISMITLVITIIVIIILAGIGGYYSFEAIEQATQKDIREEIRNVEEVIGAAKAKGLAGEFIPNKNYLIKDHELESMFSGALTDEQIEIINNTNEDDTISPLKKYYLLDKNAFDAEFGDSEHIDISGLKRTYLVSYEDRVVIINNNGTIISSGEIKSEEPINSEMKVVFNPNGSQTWSKTQSTGITVSGVGIKSMQYMWTTSSEEPAFLGSNFTNGELITLNGETGNNWYVWVVVTYDEDGIEKRYKARSNQFYIDNTAPTGTLDVSGISK